MNMVRYYLGKLNYKDPLYEILLSHVCPDVKDPLFHVNGMSSRRVYKYTEEKSSVAIIGKFFRLDDTKEDRVLRIKGEYNNLQLLRTYGFDVRPNYVVRPITRDERIGLALVEDFIPGKDLNHYLRQAIYGGDHIPLQDRLSRLASFLYSLHAKTGTTDTVELDLISRYFQKVLDKIYQQGVISDGEKVKFLKLMDKWLKKSLIRKARNVTVHGDATPTNFIFTDRGDVVAIDLERMKKTDMVYDISMVCGELKHAFLWRADNPYSSEPFIRHFLKSYARHFPDNKRAFREITLRNPFYMALTELRIVRNSYLDWHYRKKLANEALECLRWGLKLK